MVVVMVVVIFVVVVVLVMMAVVVALWLVVLVVVLVVVVVVRPYKILQSAMTASSWLNICPLMSTDKKVTREARLDTRPAHQQ